MKKIFEKVWLKSFPGFYGTWFEPDVEQSVIEGIYSDEYDLGKIDDFWRYFDNKGYMEGVCVEFTGIVENELRQYFGDLVMFRYNSLSSPREYNFYNDTLYADIEIKDFERFNGLFDKWIEEHKDYINGRLADDFTPRSGFIPFYENTFDKFILGAEPGNNAWAILLSYIVEYGQYGNADYPFEAHAYEMCNVSADLYFNFPEQYKK